jgi:threonine dehydrogenase-like Zn-dependent dehydrogenase
MRAAVTERAGRMVLVEQPEPPPPGPGEVVIRPEAVGICGDAEFADAVAVVERNGAPLARLISHEFGLDQAPEAISFAMSNPAEVMKVVIRST